MWTRRSALAGAVALAACKVQVDLPPPSPVPLRPDPRFAEIEARTGGRLGIYALNTADGAVLSHRGEERFAMCSTFKWLLAAQMLWLAEREPGFLAQRVAFNADDLLEYAPAARARLAPGATAGEMSVEELAEAAVVLSDNTAANLLLERGGGPAGLTQFLRNYGDDVTRLDRTEPELNIVPPGDMRDTTTPAAMARTMQRMLAGEAVLNALSRDKLIGWMRASRTGLERLRAALPMEWRAGDKTGTWNGEHNATNDVAIGWPPRPGARAPVMIACYLTGAAIAPAARNAAHAEVARIVAADWG